MKTDPESAKELVTRLHKYSYGSNYTDNELVTRALRTLPNEGVIICAAILLYYEATKALPEYALLIFLSIIVTTAVFCWFTRRKIKSLQAVQNIFLDAAPSSLDDALKKISGQNCSPTKPFQNMARYFIAPLLVALGIICIFGGIAVPVVCLPYSQGYADIAVTVARKPEKFDNPMAHIGAINDALEGSNRLSNVIAITSAVSGVIAGGALVFAAQLLSKSTDLSRRLADARSKLEAEIAAKYPSTKEGESGPRE